MPNQTIKITEGANEFQQLNLKPIAFSKEAKHHHHHH